MNTIDLTQFCKTKSQARDFSTRLAAISEKVYETDFNLESTLIHFLGLPGKDAFLSLLRESGTPVTKPTDLKNFLASLQEKLARLPVLSLVLAFEPDETTLKILTDWFLMNTKQHVLFDISVDPKLIAGVAIKFNGRYVEYSIKPSVTKIITAALSPQAIPVQQSKQIAPAPTHQSVEHMSIGR